VFVDASTYLVGEEAVAGLDLSLEEVEAGGGSSSEARHERGEASSEHIHGGLWRGEGGARSEVRRGREISLSVSLCFSLCFSVLCFLSFHCSVFLNLEKTMKIIERRECPKKTNKNKLF
jgi:hypothetical protein